MIDELNSNNSHSCIRFIPNSEKKSFSYIPNKPLYLNHVKLSVSNFFFGDPPTNFLMNVEGKYLCSEDCKGLCQHCGADLNEGDCGCSQENIDPRWAALVDIMEKDK